MKILTVERIASTNNMGFLHVGGKQLRLVGWRIEKNDNYAIIDVIWVTLFTRPLGAAPEHAAVSVSLSLQPDELARLAEGLAEVSDDIKKQQVAEALVEPADDLLDAPPEGGEVLTAKELASQ